MEKWLVTFLILFTVLSLKASSRDFKWSMLTIDCGTSTSGDPGLRTDEEFIKTGQNKLISIPNVTKEMSTLKFFPDKVKNCYKISVFGASKYHIRAGFLYGNYDGTSKPPTFDLQINDETWTTVSTSLSEEPIYYEAVYPMVRDKVSICLVRTRDGEFPFISVLQAIMLSDEFYTSMDNKTLLSLESRVHFIRDQDTWQWTPLIYEDRYNRIWKTKYVPEYQNITSDRVYDRLLSGENKPPEKVLAGAIQARNISDSVSLMVDFPQLSQVSAYFVFYFMKPNEWIDIGGTRKIKIFMDNREMAITEVPDNHTCQVVTFYPVVVSSSVNVTISPVEGSTMPPIINAMEMFIAKDLKQSKGGRLQHYSLVSCMLLVVVFFCLG